MKTNVLVLISLALSLSNGMAQEAPPAQFDAGSQVGEEQLIAVMDRLDAKRDAHTRLGTSLEDEQERLKHSGELPPGGRVTYVWQSLKYMLADVRTTRVRPTTVKPQNFLGKFL